MASTPKLVEFLQNYSVEVTGSDSAVEAACKAGLPKGTEVYVAFVPGESHAKIVSASVKIRRAGLEPVPHLVARSIPNAAHLDNFLAALAGEAGVDRVLSIGGDIPQPAGPFTSSLDLIRTGALQKHGITKFGISAYPEPHPKIAADKVEESVAGKFAYIKENALDVWFVSQFCFEAAPIEAWLDKRRAQGIDLPFRAGIAGPASRKTLWKYALYCGIGNSLKALGSRPETMQQLAFREAPDALVSDVARLAQKRPELKIAGFHLFTFGGVPDTAKWASELLASQHAALVSP